jgi:hypothetical protein
MRNSTASRRQAGFFVIVSSALLGLSAASAAGAATSDAAPSVHEGHAALQALCPQAGEQIQAALGGAVWRHQLATTLHASLVLKGSQISEVQVSGSPPAYTLRLQRALTELQCQGDAAGAAQLLRFDVATLTR